MSQYAEEDLIDLAVAAPSPDSTVIEGAVESALASLAGELAGRGSAVSRGYYPMGVPLLREVVAARYTTRGAVTCAEQILVTAGAMGALHLLACSVFGHGGDVLVEQPTYPTALDALRATPAQLVPFPVTSEGWDVDQLATMFHQIRPQFAYLIVDFHNPTGALLDLPGREALLAAADQAGTLLVVDETNVELALDGGDLPPPLAALDEHDRVVSVGSMSKAFWGGLRVGWIRASPSLVARLATARHSIDPAGPVLEHLVAADLLAHAEEPLRARRHDLAERRDVLSAALHGSQPRWHWRQPAGGLCLWVTLDGAISTPLMTTAKHHGLRLTNGPRFGLDATLERFLRLPYVLNPAELREGVRRLAAAHAEVTRGSRRRW